MEVPWLTPGYVDKLKAFLSRNRVLVVLRDDLVDKDISFTLPYVDPRQLLFSPSLSSEDIYRDAVLMKVFNVPVSDVSIPILRRALLGYGRAKVSLSSAFLEKLSEVKL